MKVELVMVSFDSTP